jgi:hypothetical protein
MPLIIFLCKFCVMCCDGDNPCDIFTVYFRIRYFLGRGYHAIPEVLFIVCC